MCMRLVIASLWSLQLPARMSQLRYALADRFTRNSSIHLASANPHDYRVEDHTLPVISGAVYDGRFVVTLVLDYLAVSCMVLQLARCHAGA